MNSLILSQQKLFGLLELDAEGTVLYFKSEGDEGSSGDVAPDITGRNFFSDVAPFKNVEEFHHRLDIFQRGSEPANSFEFDCDYEDEVVPVRVLLARMRERSKPHTTKSMLVHIRKAH